MSTQTRRNLLILRMTELEAQGQDCKGCSGKCCTYEANSMMVTPVEVLELQHFLKQTGSLDANLKNKCLETVEKFRLNRPTGNGRRSFVRRTYTCPFFNHGEFGCPLPRNIKPYGCLAFNNHHAELKAAEFCYSEIDLLEQREKSSRNEAQLNEKLKMKYKLFWEKSPLPVALLEVWDVEVSAVDLE